jgi:putative ABC transport system permease protein
VSFDPELQRYTAARRMTFVAELAARASSLPGVASAAATNCLPFSGEAHHVKLVAQSTGRAGWAAAANVSPRYFETLRLPLVRGRDFSPAEAASEAPVAIVSETLARQLWPSGDAIGQRLRVDGASEPWRDVIGIARDAKYLRLTEAPQGAYYAPGTAPRGGAPVSLVVRTERDPTTTLRAIEGIAHGLDADLPLFHAQRLEDGIRQSVSLQRAAAALFGVFGALALLLASLGIYGVAAGLVISGAASVLMTAYLFGLTATDALTFAAGSAVLGVVTVAATYVPAARAARVDPLAALRHE